MPVAKKIRINLIPALRASKLNRVVSSRTTAAGDLDDDSDISSLETLAAVADSVKSTSALGEAAKSTEGVGRRKQEWYRYNMKNRHTSKYI